MFALAAAFSGAVELVQAATGVGICEAQDFLNNTVGAFGAVVVAWLFTSVAPRRTSMSATKHTTGSSATRPIHVG